MNGASQEPWLVVGLGNPGPGYSRHRHNVGHMVLDVLASRVTGGFRSQRARRVDVLEGRLAGVRTVLAKLHTYMNVSGPPVAALAAFYKIPPERLVVVHDDLDIPFGEIRLKAGGGDGGHNGLRSVTQALGGAKGFLRVRVGIGRPPGRVAPADYVLSAFSSGERRELAVTLEIAADAVESLVTEGLASSQNRFN